MAIRTITLLFLAGVISGALAQTSAAATPSSSPTPATIPGSVNGCHLTGSVQYCIGPDGTEYEILQTPAIDPLPESYSDCHDDGSGEIYCHAPDGSEVPVAAAAAGHTDEHAGEPAGEHAGEPADAHTDESTGQAAESTENCDYHGNVLHCSGGGEGAMTCEPIDQDYNMSLRIGLIFVIFATSGFAVFAPVLLERFSKMTLKSTIFTILKQFGTGVIIATALVHLLTHAQMQFDNECLGELVYHATAAAIAMGGIFLSFAVEYIGNRFVARRNQAESASVDSEEQLSTSPKDTNPTVPRTSNTSIAALGHAHPIGLHPDTHFSVAVMEAGVMFHSILIGINLNVTPNSAYNTLFVVILFHQMFEGLALGIRIAALKSSISLLTKIIMAGAFAVITPIGMAIGAGVLETFNGNDPTTIVTIGTLNALSAGILLWVGLVEMLAHDWMYGDLANAGLVRGIVGGASLVAGLALMSLLGKWT
ncbi:uncharacterized protein L3040_007686 [Drepanopeziza brunnea f. sp. 'multigermtubi']|uniref:Zinc/iron transporter n=1 Tax=Marssonina brunnea f. sp. multigermtubi (strain MB_m1) TaxID=1072389 RepID=K1WKH4_MARBU|nr:zinc/iron transporter [Drepanopeziza brunnea f. sp. 'multigermtubi' MB_m1]EKD18135.1 zinc/iron transporter [Drepanopeziza brunnea f. sp. 'multigermtubi' MB_m1]KAJ5037512.1 hypothetical protein L3040_007686 [Drepanopeziza brunnea f. sp. 'multigermtubi']